MPLDNGPSLGQEEAATKIQAQARGNAGRRLGADLRKEKAEEEARSGSRSAAAPQEAVSIEAVASHREPRAEAAATKIQAQARGNAGRRRIAGMRQDRAATKIQARVRGRAGRRLSAQIRAGEAGCGEAADGADATASPRKASDATGARQVAKLRRGDKVQQLFQARLFGGGPLAKCAPRRACEETRARLTAHKKDYTQGKQDFTEEHTFRPCINSNAKSLSKSECDEYWNRLHRPARYEERWETTSAKHAGTWEDRAAAVCTFEPTLNPRSRNLAKSRANPQPANHPVRVEEAATAQNPFEVFPASPRRPRTQSGGTSVSNKGDEDRPQKTHGVAATHKRIKMGLGQKATADLVSDPYFKELRQMLKAMEF